MDHRLRIGRLAALAGLIVLASCSRTPQYVANWSRVTPGLSKAQVRALLGEPSAQVDPTIGPDGKPVQPSLFTLFAEPEERWDYYPLTLEDLKVPGARSVLAPPNEAFVVYFDAAGLVTRLRSPLRGPYAGSR